MSVLLLAGSVQQTDAQTRRKTTTRTTTTQQRTAPEIWPSLCKVRDDYDNNFIFSDGSKIIIYNPDGIVGYEKARGKIIKP